MKATPASCSALGSSPSRITPSATEATGWIVSVTDVSAAGSRGSETVISSQPTTCEVSASRTSQPWAGQLGTRLKPFTSLLSTTRAVLFSPQRFFDELQPDGPLGAPVLYFLICSAITAVISVVASLTFLAVPVGIAVASGSLDAGLLTRVLTIFVLASLVVLPALFIAGYFASVLVLHAFVRLIAGRY